MSHSISKLLLAVFQMRSHNLAWFWVCISVPLESRSYFLQTDLVTICVFWVAVSNVAQQNEIPWPLNVFGVAQHEGISQNGPVGCLALYVFCSRCVLDAKFISGFSVWWNSVSSIELPFISGALLLLWHPPEAVFQKSWRFYLLLKRSLRGIWSVLLCLEYGGFFSYFIFCSYASHKVLMQSEPLCKAFLTWVSLNWFIQLCILNRHLFSNSEWHMTHSSFRSVVYAVITDIIIQILSC